MKGSCVFYGASDETSPMLLPGNVLSIDDLSPGMILPGRVQKVVAFGAFVDVGVGQSGLLNISKIPRGEHLGVGDILAVEILSVDKERGRISLGWTT